MDEAGLAELCELEWPRLVGFLGLYTGDRDLAEDLAQEALTRLCRDWRKVSRLPAPTGWLYRVAMNLAHSHFRRVSLARRRRPLLVERVDGQDLAEVLAVRAAVSELPERQRATLLLRYFADLPVRDVAEILECSEGTVKSQTSDALAVLRTKGLADQPSRALEGVCDEG